MTHKKTSNSWKKIQQKKPNQLLTRHALWRHRKKILKTLALLAISCTLVGILALGTQRLKSFGLSAWEKDPKLMLRKIVFLSDGALDDQWLKNHFTVPESVGLMNIDLHKMQKKLRETAQIKSATLERIFPDTLKISIEEHKPLLRVIFVDAQKKRQIWLVSTEGAIYPPANYPAEKLAGLPVAQGIKLRKTARGFARIPHMGTVHQLLKEAHAKMPNEADSWRLIWLEELQNGPHAPGASITVSRPKAYKIRFGTSDFSRQLSRLEDILEHLESNSRIAHIDLSLESPSVQLK